MAGAAVLANPGEMIGPQVPQADLAVAQNFERLDGLTALDHPANDDTLRYIPAGGPRPGQSQGTPDVYTPGPIAGVVGTVGGQPLPVSARIYREAGVPSLVHTPSVQWRLGQGGRGPSELGAAQTVTLSQISSNPPVPGDLASIIAGLA